MIPVIVPVAQLMWLYMSYTAISACLKTCHVAGTKMEWYVHFAEILYARIHMKMSLYLIIYTV